jgi:hypothetical protein
MQFVEVHAVELSWNLQKLQMQVQHYYWGKFFFNVVLMVMKYLWKHPPMPNTVLLRCFMDCTKDFNEKTLCTA